MQKDFVSVIIKLIIDMEVQKSGLKKGTGRGKGFNVQLMIAIEMCAQWGYVLCITPVTIDLQTKGYPEKMVIRRIMKKLACLIKGHDIDWAEYDLRMQKEEHHADPKRLFCARCKKYEIYP